ncbi:hypothetical protein [Chamaesiphon sp. OTE_75_metabat_556]|uniref:hypothetical protein n=1 Tax=Chamaesiphon sp. OTE_75_metabat_556 TaxID=2964692 RepID=UPI00286BEEC6|nr:hypothetical protein [Chamaesiphon sp. OTE_75_metabat_556]
MDELEAAELEIKQSRSIPTGTLQLNLSIARGELPPILTEFRLGICFLLLVSNERSRLSFFY